MFPLTVEAGRQGLKRYDNNPLSRPVQLSVVCTVALVGHFFPPPPLAASLGLAEHLCTTLGSPAVISVPEITSLITL